ncbi:MAG: ADP-ribosylglycohydrolase family protein [Deltaproteobacteria bacterium]|nr:ADP-ribosylglycohydrolase family protein [Deltaproteobacteria bacterium]
MKTAQEKQEAVKRSALWAAYGDALGYITELTDEKGLKWRAGTTRITTTIPWKRRIGGKFGVVVELPAGCYSDDTQLRLATCRAIRGDGKFDVEAFAKVEVPVWLSYALGAGRGSKAAAVSLTRKDTAWTNNFFDNKTARYINCGGNGAAMRIQPHVWAAVDLGNIETFLPDVIRNAICTHGHPRGILGAVFHALCLAYTLQHKKIPGPNEWQNFVDCFHPVPELIHHNSELHDFWLPTWEQSTGRNIKASFSDVAGECLKDIDLIMEMTKNDPASHYADIVKGTGAMSPQYRGSGTKTAILAVALAWIYKHSPKEAIEVAANLLGSDTDTIATMSGAIIGAATDEYPTEEICDKTYIEKEAFRLCAISRGEQTKSFTYPDLLKWNVSSVQSDFVGTVRGSLAVSGLGYVETLGTSYEQKGKNGAVWQWLHLATGQQIFAKRRLKPVVIPITNLPLQVEKEHAIRQHSERAQANLFDIGRKKEVQRPAPQKQLLTLDQATKQAINSGFNPSLIGRMLLEFSERNDGIELAMGFSAIIAKARRARIDQKERR